jgi:hypothetical protein
MFTPVQLVLNWREQRPSNYNDLDSSVTEEVGRVYYTRGGSASDFFLVPFYVIGVANGTLCIWVYICKIRYQVNTMVECLHVLSISFNFVGNAYI